MKIDRVSIEKKTNLTETCFANIANYQSEISKQEGIDIDRLCPAQLFYINLIMKAACHHKLAAMSGWGMKV